MNVKSHFEARPVTMTSYPIWLFITCMTLIPSLAYTECKWFQGSICNEWHARRVHLPFPTLCFDRFGTCICINCWYQFSKFCQDFLTFHREYRSVLTRFCFWYDFLIWRFMKCVSIVKQNRESTEGYSRWKVELRHGKFEQSGLNNWSTSKSQNGRRN